MEVAHHNGLPPGTSSKLERGSLTQQTFPLLQTPPHSSSLFPPVHGSHFPLEGESIPAGPQSLRQLVLPAALWALFAPSPPLRQLWGLLGEALSGTYSLQTLPCSLGGDFQLEVIQQTDQIPTPHCYCMHGFECGDHFLQMGPKSGRGHRESVQSSHADISQGTHQQRLHWQ